MSVKRFLIAVPSHDGGVELFPMKEWLRQHAESVPSGLDATQSTSHQLRNGLKAAGWSVQTSDSEVRLIRPVDVGRKEFIDEVLGSASGDEDSDHESAEGMTSSGQAFELEYQLRDFLASNLGTLNINDVRLKLYVDLSGRDGIEYPTAVGPIDILAVDAAGNFTVFELKRARTADRAVGQLARYMGWLKHTIGRGKGVSGVIVARDIDERLRYAASVIPGVALFEYRVEFHLEPATAIRDPGAPANDR